MKKIKIDYRWMDGISMLLAFITSVLVIYIIGSMVPDELAELGSILGILSLPIFFGFGKAIYLTMKLFLDDGRKNY